VYPKPTRPGDARKIELGFGSPRPQRTGRRYGVRVLVAEQPHPVSTTFSSMVIASAVRPADVLVGDRQIDLGSGRSLVEGVPGVVERPL